ncbi:hypothetical protein [Peribacillus frigoritolerans]|uniref:hypothetical protein n=1 Tax=Peribacillus frigoritolerans TaxID=450367 RepID=UPI003305A944
MSNNHFDQTVDRLLVDLSQIMTEYDQKNLRILIGSYMKYISKFHGQSYNSRYYFDAMKVDHIKHRILADYYIMK